MARIRLSPSGPFLNGVPLFNDGAILRGTYWCACPASDEVVGSQAVLATFNVNLPLTLPDGDTFDPNLLTYVILTNLVGETDTTSGTAGPCNLVVDTQIFDAGLAQWLTVQNLVNELVDSVDEFVCRSAVHASGTEVDILDVTKVQIFRPKDLPNYVYFPNAPAAWVAGTSQPIRVTTGQASSETGNLVLPAYLSRVMMLEFYGTAAEIVGVGGP